MQKLYLAMAGAILVAGCDQPESVVVTEGADAVVDAAAPSGSIEFANDNERTIYTLGIALGEQIAPFDLTADERELFRAGLEDALDEEPYQVDVQTYGARIQSLVNERMMARAEQEKAAGADFANEIAEKPGAVRTESGLVFVPLEEGEGESPEPTDTVLAHYHGTLRDGTVFDSSVDRGEPVQFPLDRVIPCWTEGLPMMQVGGRAEFLCPSDIAYGDQGTSGIPGGAALLFEVELLDVVEIIDNEAEAGAANGAEADAAAEAE